MPNPKLPRPASEYRVLRSIPILDEHDLTDGEGNVERRIDEAALHQIASNGNRRVRETGDYCPVVIGHTKDGVPEDEQPEIVGYACNFRVKRLGKTRRYAIHADLRIKRDKYDKCRNYPRRSVEFWPNRMEIDPIALLGATTPERDLGLIHYQRDGSGRPLRYSRLSPDPKVTMTPPTDMPPADPKAGGDSKASSVAQEVLAMLKESDVWKWAEAQMSASEQPPEDPNAPPMDDGMVPPDMAGDNPMPDEMDDPSGMDDAGMDEDEVESDEGDDEEPQRYNAGAPSGSNTFVPAGPGKGRKPDVVAKMSRQHREEIARYQREFEQAKAAQVDLNAKVVRMSRERDLIKLETREGLIFDLDEELDLVASMDAPTYAKHLNIMRKRYNRAPVGGQALAVHLAESGGRRSAGGRTRDDVNRIAEYATAKGITYAQALTECKGEGVL